MKKSTNHQLEELMDQHPELSRKQVAEALRVNTSTVDRWLAPQRSGGKKNTTYRAMPAGSLLLLRILLGIEKAPIIILQKD